MSSSSRFLTCIQVFQEAGQVVWYSHLFQNFPQFIVIHTVKGFSIVNKAKKMSFSLLGTGIQSRKSRNTWNNRQIWPWSIEWSRAKENRVSLKLTNSLVREHTSHSKHPLPKTQEKTLHMDITRWPTPKSDWLYSLQPKMEIYTVSKNKTGSWWWLRSWTPYCQIQT